MSKAERETIMTNVSAVMAAAAADQAPPKAEAAALFGRALCDINRIADALEVLAFHTDRAAGAP